MKRTMLCAVSLVAVMMSGWSQAGESLDVVDLCGGHDLLKDEGNRVYQGEFKGRGGSKLKTALVVTPIRLNKATIVFYVWGAQPEWNIDEAGCVPGLGYWKSGTFRVTTIRKKGGIRYKFSEAYDKADATYLWSGGKTKGKVAQVSGPPVNQ